jgi:hypothetical protein
MCDSGRRSCRGRPPDRWWASLASVGCLLRATPLFFGAAPRTPLRVLCLIALDAMHVLRYRRPLRRARLSELATVLDFQAATNAIWDGKDRDNGDYVAMRLRLETAGVGPWVEGYVSRLGALESRRPPVGGDQRRFDDVRKYREAVARLSLATVIGIALHTRSLDETVLATHRDADLAALFGIVMQFQIMDDVLDREEDMDAGLPSFLTACASLPQTRILTARAARSYGTSQAYSAAHIWWPLRLALWLLTAAAMLVIRFGVPLRVPSRAGRPLRRGRPSPT